MTRIPAKAAIIAVAGYIATAIPAYAQDATATAAAVATQTAAAIATATATHFTHTPTPTKTPNVTLQKRGQRLTSSRLSTLIQTSPAAQQANLAEILQLGVRSVRMPATNAAKLGLADVGTVTGILAFVASTGAPATKTLLVQGTDFTVAAGDVVPIGDHSSELWLIFYRP